MNQIYPDPAMGQQENLNATNQACGMSQGGLPLTGIHGYVPGIRVLADAPTVSKAFHDSEMARMRERCSRLAAMLAEALKG